MDTDFNIFVNSMHRCNQQTATRHLAGEQTTTSFSEETSSSGSPKRSEVLRSRSQAPPKKRGTTGLPMDQIDQYIKTMSLS